MLNARPRMPALTGSLPARDLYVRLAAFIATLKQQQAIPSRVNIGLLGMSGGASRAIHLLHREHHLLAEGRTLLFNRGAIAYSPILDHLTTFHVLDGASATILDQGFPEKRTLTSLDMLLTGIFKGYSLSNLTPYFQLLAQQNRSAGRTHRCDQAILP